METPALDWLSSIGTGVFVTCVIAFFAVNGIAAYAFIRTRDRDLVNRWTSRLLAANLAIIGAGIGIPIATAMARIAITSFSSSVQPRIEISKDAMEKVPLNEAPSR